jgi:hypothetical protein
VAAALVLLSPSGLAEDMPWATELPFETAIIHYELDGSVKGTETLYIRDHGRETAKVSKTKTKLLFVTSEKEEIEIMTPEKIYQIDMEKKKGTYVTNPVVFMEQELKKLGDQERQLAMENMKTIGIDLGMRMGATVKKGADSHLGYDCDVTQFMGTRSCQISGTPITLKTEGNIAGLKMNSIATGIEEGATIDPALFQVPEDVKLRHDAAAEEASREMARMMVTSFSNPDAVNDYDQATTDFDAQMEEARQAAQQQQAAAEERQAANQAAEQSADKEPVEQIKKGLDLIKGFF